MKLLILGLTLLVSTLAFADTDTEGTKATDYNSSRSNKADSSTPND